MVAPCGPAAHISIHALREEGDLMNPERRARRRIYFYPRPPRGGRPSGSRAQPSARRVTQAGSHQRQGQEDFYPRPPRGGRREQTNGGVADCCISIHALREEGDLLAEPLCADVIVFLSTPSARRATRYDENGEAYLEISIHALREEGDRLARRFCESLCIISIHALREEGDVW